MKSSEQTKPSALGDVEYQASRKLRERLPPEQLAGWKPKLRKKSVAALLKASTKDRLHDLTGLRYQRMSASPFGFFRGSACVMAYDLSLIPNTGLEAQLCGDAHVQNLGAYEGVDGRLIFDINDFDESVRGPFEWDLKRMATSILLAGREAGLKEGTVDAAAEAFLTAYLRLTGQFLAMPVLDVARFQVHRLGAVAPISKILQQAEHSTPQHLLESLTSAYSKGRTFKSNPPLLRRIEDKSERESVLHSLKPYLNPLLPERRHFFARFKPLDVAFKVVGTGSVGLRDYTIYFEGNGPSDPLFLQIKQEADSCYAPYLSQSKRLHNGQRVAEAQRAMQVQSDPLLGWTTIGDHQYLVRQLNDHKASVELASLKANDLCQYSTVCGEMLARGHARSGDVRQIAGYAGKGGRFKKAILAFAHAYASQASADFRAFVKANKA